MVYAVCGANRKAELIHSINSLLLFATAAAKAKPAAIHHVHIISDGGILARDLPRPHKRGFFCYSLHQPTPHAAPLFAPCSTQRLYLHEHTAFADIAEVSHNTTLPFSALLRNERGKSKFVHKCL